MLEGFLNNFSDEQVISFLEQAKDLSLYENTRPMIAKDTKIDLSVIEPALKAIKEKLKDADITVDFIDNSVKARKSITALDGQYDIFSISIEIGKVNDGISTKITFGMFESSMVSEDIPYSINACLHSIKYSLNKKKEQYEKLIEQTKDISTISNRYRRWIANLGQMSFALEALVGYVE